VTVTAEEPVSLPVEEPEPAPTRRPSRRSSRKESREEGPSAVARRSQAAFAREPGSPAFTGMLVATCLLFAFVGSVFAVMLWKGYYNDEKKSVFVPTYLQGMQKSAAHWGDPE
jgi:hypothetical protein